MTPRPTTAQLVEYLVDYDGPQLALLKTSRGRNMLAHAVQRSGMKDPFFGCEVPEKAYDKYFSGTADLNYAFQQANKTAYFFFDNAYVEGEGDTVTLEPASPDELKNQDNWPRVGIFSRSHTSMFNRTKVVTALKSYKIDGKWDASDFSHFYGKMSDLYSLFAVLNRLEGATAPTERAFFAHSLKERLWRGGGSYNGFYGDLDTQNSKHNLAPLEVARIQYASPGQLELRGDKDALAYTGDVISVFEDDARALLKTYNAIHGILRKAKLLKAGPNAEFPSRAIRDHVHQQTLAFAKELKLENIDDMYAASGPNILVFAKLILSIYRRASELYMFEAEGRVQRTA